MNTPTKAQNFLEMVVFAVLALVIVVPIRLFIAQPFVVSGSSMVPTFQDGQYLIVDELSYRFETPKRGEVIIFTYPYSPSKPYYIKRIIGLPGETVKIQGGQVTIVNKENPDGFTLSEPYIAEPGSNDEVFNLTSSQYFVMGDNRPSSSDSRIWGPLDAKYILGRPILRLLPVTGISVFPGAFAEPK